MKVVYLIKKKIIITDPDTSLTGRNAKPPGAKRQLIPSNCVNMMLFPCGCINTLGKYWTHMSFVCFPSTYPRAVFLQPDLEGRARAAVQQITFSPVQEAADGLGRAPGSAAVAVQNVVFPGAFGRSISSRGDASTPVTAAGICQHGLRAGCACWTFKCYASGRGSCVRKGRRVWGAWKVWKQVWDEEMRN